MHPALAEETVEHELSGVALPVTGGEGLRRVPEGLEQRRVLLGELLDVESPVEVLADQDLRAERIAEERVREELDCAAGLSVSLLEGGLDLAGSVDPRRAEDVDVQRLLRRPVAVNDGDVAPGCTSDSLHASPVIAARCVLLARRITDPFGYAGPCGVRNLFHGR